MKEEYPRLVGMNHVALPVSNLSEALEWYGTLFDIELRGRSETKAFIDMGDQFLALGETEQAGKTTDHVRHLGLVVDDLDAVEHRINELGIERLDTPGLDIRDSTGNRLQIVAYEDVQFTKAAHVLEGMELADLEKQESALAELAEKGMSPE